MKTDSRIRCNFALGVLMALNAVHAGDNWPGFRGPTGLGYTDEKNLPLTWDGKENKNVLWKSALIGEGHASPVVWGDKIFACTVLWPPHVSREQTIPAQHVLCFQTSDGKMLWDTLVPPGPWMRNDFRSGQGGGYAACTPVTDGKLVYCVFSSSIIAAIDFEGKIAWQNKIVPFDFDVTIGSSPVIFRDTVLMYCAMREKAHSSVIAYNLSDGQIKWQQKLPDVAFSHTSPVVIDVNGKPQLLVAGGGMGPADHAMESIDPADGKMLWWCRGVTESASPAFSGGLVYFDSGRGSIGTCVDPNGTGDISKTNIKWTIPNFGGAIASPIIVDKYLYRLIDGGVLKCFDMGTGSQIYSQRLQGLTTSWASPIADGDGRIYFASAGKSFVIQSGPEFKVLATNELGDSSHASPAVAKGKIYFVGTKNIFCVGAN